MKNRILLVPAIGLLATTTTPISAQDANGDDGEFEGSRLGVPASPPAPIVPPPAPPVLLLPPPPAPAPPADYARTPTPVDWQSIVPQPADYPGEAWIAGDAGVVSYSVRVSPDGKPFDCTVLESSGSAALDAKTCEIVMERGDFEPALDNDGNAIEGIFREMHRWVKREPEFPGTLQVSVRFILDENGLTQNCEILEMSGAMSDSMRRSLEREPCPGMARPAPGLYRDENGNPVAKRVTVTFNVEVEDLVE
ncbi:MAG: TonB family protein [Pseudomonadota bacterium]